MEKINILIVEDEFIIFTHLQKLLKKIGFTNVHVAKTYTQALELASKHTFHILLSDIRINGEKDGIETAKILQKLYNLTVVFITAYNDEETLTRVSEVEFIGYLLKPYRVDELETLISLSIIKHQFLHPPVDLKTSGPYSFDMNTQILYKEDKVISLTKKEQLFFSLMFRDWNVTISYGVLDEIVWQNETVSDNTRRTFLYRIKQKFPDLPFKTIANTGVELG